MGNTVKNIILLIMELALGTAFGFQGYRVCQSHELLVNSIWFVQCAWMLIMHLERIVLKKKWLVPLAYLHLGLYLAGLFHIISISDYNYYEPTRLTPVFECMFFCSIFMMPTLLLYVMVWNIMNLIKRNMAGGEKKRVSPIDSEKKRERLRRMEERMHGPVDQEAAVDEAEVELAPATETTLPAESQRVDTSTNLS